MGLVSRSFAVVAVSLTLVAVTDADDAPCGYLVRAGSVPLEGIEGRLDHFAADPATRRLFVAALENHSVEVIDLATKQMLHSIKGIIEPQGLEFLPESKRLLVCSRGDGTCRSFNAATLEEGPWLDLGRNADNIRLDATAGRIYVGSGAEPGPGLLSAIDAASFLPENLGGKPGAVRSKADLLTDRPRQADLEAEVELAAHPESFQLDSVNHRVYVNIPDDHQVGVIDVTPEGLKVVAKWAVTEAEKNFPMALDVDSSRLFVVCRKPACVLVFDIRNGKMIAQAPCVGDSDDVFYDARNRRLYVIGGEGFVDVFGSADNAVDLTRIDRIPTATKARTGFFVPALQLLAVAVPHTVDHPAAILLFQTKE